MTGRSRRYTLFTLPLNKGTINDPTININAGGTILIIIVFTPFNNFSQSKLCCQNKAHTCNKSISGIKARPFFPGKMTVLVNKEINYYKRQATPKKQHQEYLYISRIIK